jgi:hypothetical protein
MAMIQKYFSNFLRKSRNSSTGINGYKKCFYLEFAKEADFMTVEYSISVCVVLFIAAFCVCFMLRFHNFAIRSANEIEKGPTKAVRVIRATDAVMDAVEE